jgi:ATP-dependent Lhr-like helicase
MEARGEIRGGRFVEGVSGEQFALPEAVGTLRKIRQNKKMGQLTVLSSADPLNLVGILLPGEKIGLSAHTDIVFKDGVAIAVRHKNEIEYLCDLDEEIRQSIKIEFGKIAIVQRV